MACVSDDDDLLIITCINTTPEEANTNTVDSEILISTPDVVDFDISTFLHYQVLNVHAHRRRLIEKSSYFRGIFSGDFSDSNTDRFSVQWNLYGFLNMLKCIYGRKIYVSSSTFLVLFETALYFGVDVLANKCKSWFSESLSPKEATCTKIELDDLIHIWEFGLEHANDFLPGICECYLARNFMWAMSNHLFRDVPYNLLLCCIKHPDLTVDSEMDLAKAILFWLDVNNKQSKLSRQSGDGGIDILKQIKVRLLPLWFIAGKRRPVCYSELAIESILKIFELLMLRPILSTNSLPDNGKLSKSPQAVYLHHTKIRLTDHSRKVDISSCPQIASEIVCLSLLPSEYGINPKLRKEIEDHVMGIKWISVPFQKRKQLPFLSFHAVEEVDISKCTGLHLAAVIECFSKSFPSLRKLTAAHLSYFKSLTLYKLMSYCPRISELDLTVDITPLIASSVSTAPSSSENRPLNSNVIPIGLNGLFDLTHGTSAISSGITKLTLEGRTEIYDSDLMAIASLCNCLQYINLKGCVSVTDACIASLIQKCTKLHSILVCETSFGVNSVKALCSAYTRSEVHAPHIENTNDTCTNPLVYGLQILHMGGCKGVDEGSLFELLSQSHSLKSLCLRGTQLVDDALYHFPGSSLEMLDVSDTKISGTALAHIVRTNAALKTLKARDCKNFVRQDSNINQMELSRELYTELGKCTLEEIAFGWGFSCFSLLDMKPAIVSLKTITIGLGGSFDYEALKQLTSTCPQLKTLVLCFQKICNSFIINIASSLTHLEVLSLCYCHGDLSFSNFTQSMPNLRKLTLKRVTPFMTNDSLVILTQNCPNMVELSLLGCRLLNPESLDIISIGWPGLTSIHLEECGNVTEKGASSIFQCVALEELLLRHSGPGLSINFIYDAASKMPMLRQISLDVCDTCEDGFGIPNDVETYSLRTMKITRCRFQESALKIGFPPHEETLVIECTSRGYKTTVVKERL